MTPTLHRCTSCRERKPQDQFYGNPYRKPGISSRCKDCARASAKAKSEASRAVRSLKRTTASKKPKTRQKPRKCKIRARSTDKAKWERLYHLKVAEDTHFGTVYRLDLTEPWNPKVVGYRGGRAGCERHHPAGRAKFRILCYFYVTPDLHKWIHGNGKEARRIGALLPEFEGRKSLEWQNDPFRALKELKDLEIYFS
jgi:hypothetical protein